ncbi:hypothetical protein NCGM2209_3757 [Mycobacterium tuberculosis NCGM2209]|nr:hypothetical protein NCGM2209_3757 [Mycobacterium tuberculosis NCGM2209]
MGLRAHRARAAGVGHCALAVVGDPSGTGRTLAAAAAEQPGLPGRLAVGLGRGDRRLCCGLRRTWRFEHNIAGLGILATGGPRVGTDRVRRASVADPASPHRNAGLDARIRQLHPGTRRIGRGRAGGGETRGADHLRGGRIGHRQRRPRRRGFLDLHGILCHVGCIHGRDPDIGLRGCR